MHHSMITLRNSIVAILLSVFFSTTIRAQNTSGKGVLDAMTDELQRNMKELKLRDLDRPFFMLYEIDDQKNYNVTASMGAIIHSSSVPARIKTNARVLVG